MFRVILLGLVLVFLVGCASDDNTEEVPYYRFTSEDENFIIDYNYSEGQIIRYQNQDGQEVQLRVVVNSREKSTNYSNFTNGFNFNTTPIVNFYDSKIIRLEVIGNQNYEGNKGLVSYVFSRNRDRFTNGINLPMWNVSSSILIDESQNPINILLQDFNNTNQMEMTIETRTFENVVVIDSESTEEYFNFIYGTIAKNVNRVYYDYAFGIIRFDDIEGNEWELIYPQE